MLYSYGDDWARVFQVFPENLLQIPLTPQPLTAQPTRSRGERDEDELTPTELRQRCRANLPSTVEDQSAGLSGRYDEDDVFRDAVTNYHRGMIRGYLFLADEETMRTSLVMLVFFDNFGRAVRQKRVTDGDCHISGAWFSQSIWNYDQFLEADPGPAYQVGGICGPPFADDDVPMI
jgi:hypothetical protein